jgi:hypothetical protein
MGLGELPVLDAGRSVAGAVPRRSWPGLRARRVLAERLAVGRLLGAVTSLGRRLRRTFGSLATAPQTRRSWERRRSRRRALRHAEHRSTWQNLSRGPDALPGTRTTRRIDPFGPRRPAPPPGARGRARADAIATSMTTGVNRAPHPRDSSRVDHRRCESDCYSTFTWIAGGPGPLSLAARHARWPREGRCPHREGPENAQNTREAPPPAEDEPSTPGGGTPRRGRVKVQ